MRCTRLYRTIRKAALAFLISSYWASDFAGAHGVTITSAELKAELRRYRAAQYPKPGEFERVLASRTRTFSQELFLLRNNLISSKLLPRLGPNGAGPLGREAVRDANTAICPTGELVEHCIGYDPTRATSLHPSAAVLLEEIAAWHPKT
jgi:hypothetical protein